MLLDDLLERQKNEKAKNIELAKERLRRYARENRGRFLLFGSVAKGKWTARSDMDLISDFGEHTKSRQAATMSEKICGELGLKADVRPIDWCSDEFLAEISHHAMELK